jgi:hypothetical protein
VKERRPRASPLTLLIHAWSGRRYPHRYLRHQERDRDDIPQTHKSRKDMDDYEEAILFTFGELESRLDRLEYVLSGPKALSEEKPQTIPDRIHRIEKSLQTLGAHTSLLSDAHELRMLECFLCGSQGLQLQ